MSATQLNGSYVDADVPDQNLLRGAKAIADKIDYGSILLSVRDDDLVALENILSSKDFQDYANQFREDVPITKVYEMWSKTQPKPKVEQMGSMKNLAPSKVKEHYTDEEISKLTLDDLNDPVVWEAVRKSMTQK